MIDSLYSKNDDPAIFYFNAVFEICEIMFKAYLKNVAITNDMVDTHYSKDSQFCQQI